VNFAASMIVMFITGLILISTTQIAAAVPPVDHGLHRPEGGPGADGGRLRDAALHAVCALLMKKIQPRYLIAFGLLVEGLACLYLRGFDTDIQLRARGRLGAYSREPGSRSCSSR